LVAASGFCAFDFFSGLGHLSVLAKPVEALFRFPMEQDPREPFDRLAKNGITPISIEFHWSKT
jgi:hypothetical protein